MTNKRELKKYINRLGNDIAEVILPAAVYTKAITDEQAQDILTDLSRLQAEALSRITIAYDKAPEAFETMRGYHAAKSSYYRTAYNKIIADFEAGVDKLLEPINKASKK